MFPVIEVPDEADAFEQLGTKPKVWFRAKGNERCLFKYIIREGGHTTGEDWSEKVSSELWELLGLPHAHYDFGIWKGQKGVVCPSFVPDGGRLVHGNEVLVRLSEEYPGQKFYKVRQHTLRIVLTILRDGDIEFPINWERFEGIEQAIDVFVGYLMLDAWIGNQDRHHQNWGFVVDQDRKIHLAPTFDHASSLGWNETDEGRWERLRTKDQRRSVERYVERATSAFFSSPTSEKPLSTLDAFREAAKFKSIAANAWLKRLAQVSSATVSEIFKRIPSRRITLAAKKFATKMLEHNQRRLLALEVNK